MTSKTAGRLLLALFSFALITLAWGPVAGLIAVLAFGLVVFLLFTWKPPGRRSPPSQGPPAR